MRAKTRWLLLKLRERLRHEVCGRLYRDPTRDSSKSLVVAGTARSGTTWLANLIASVGSCRILFEPFHRDKIAELRGFSLFPYLRPDDMNPTLAEYAARVLTGAIRHRWIDSRNASLRPRRRLIKEIRANLFLGWLHAHFPHVPLLLMVRHPCAVVCSRLKVGWSAEGDLRDMLAQRALVEDFVGNRRAAIEAASTLEEQHAAIWCLHYLVPLEQFSNGSLNLVFYEDVCLDPRSEITRLGRLLNLEVDRSAYLGARRPSATSRPDSAILKGEDPVRSWRGELSSGQTRRILAMVEAFGLDHLYGDSETPLSSFRSSRRASS